VLSRQVIGPSVVVRLSERCAWGCSVRRAGSHRSARPWLDLAAPCAWAAATLTAINAGPPVTFGRLRCWGAAQWRASRISGHPLGFRQRLWVGGRDASIARLPRGVMCGLTEKIGVLPSVWCHVTVKDASTATFYRPTTTGRPPENRSASQCDGRCRHGSPAVGLCHNGHHGRTGSGLVTVPPCTVESSGAGRYLLRIGCGDGRFTSPKVAEKPEPSRQWLRVVGIGQQDATYAYIGAGTGSVAADAIYCLRVDRSGSFWGWW